MRTSGFGKLAKLGFVVALSLCLCAPVFAQSGGGLAWGANSKYQLGKGQSDYWPNRVVNLNNAIQVAGGGSHGLAITQGGTVMAWGDILGNGTSGGSNTPVQVPDLASVIQIAAGDGHCLALRNDGTGWAWGHNDYGQLGAGGGGYYSDTPIQVSTVSGLTGITQLAAGWIHSLAVKGDGTVWTWGHDAWGDPTHPDSTDYTPSHVSGLTGIIQVAGGGFHSLALKNDGTVWAWGRNGCGQLGDGTNTDSITPVRVLGLSGITQIAAGWEHSLALKSDGTVWTWGDNSRGQLGNGTTTGSSVPVQVAGLTGAIQIGTGGRLHSIALKDDGTAWAWGGNGNGELGNGTLTDSDLPIQVQGLAGVIQVSGGGDFSIALRNDYTAWAWGYNYSGQLGNGTCSYCDSTVPIQVTGITGLTAAAGGGEHSLALRNDGTAWAWGYNDYGEIGDGTFRWSGIPVQVATSYGGPPLTEIMAIAAGEYHSLALKNDGTVWAWGDNRYDQLGNGTTIYSSDVPVQVVTSAGGPALTGCTKIAGGAFHSLALKSDGTVWAWGNNGNGQLGNGTKTDSNLPVQVVTSVGGPALTGITDIAGGGDHSLALKNDGTVWAWGGNYYGELGNGTNTDSNVSVQVSGLTGITAIAGGGWHSLALKSDGTVWAWGYNHQGQLGNGTNTNSNVPVQVSGLSGITKIAGGGSHSLALKNDGTVWAWGYNGVGELGNGTNTSSNVPIQVSGLTGVTAIAGGGGHSLAIYPSVLSEVALGLTFNTALKWTDKNTQTWPSDSSASSYRLYRGVKAALPYLLNAAADSCLRYQGTETTAPTADDPTNLSGGDFYWYLVVGVNGPAEGPAGNATAGQRIVNSSGACPQ